MSGALDEMPPPPPDAAVESKADDSDEDATAATSGGDGDGDAAAGGGDDEAIDPQVLDELKEIVELAAADDESHLDDLTLAEEALALKMYLHIVEGHIPARFDLGAIGAA